MIDLLLRIDESLVPGNECNSEELLRESSEEIWTGRHIIKTLEEEVEDLVWDVENLHHELERTSEFLDDIKVILDSGGTLDEVKEAFEQRPD